MSFSIPSALFQSFSSKELYRDVAANWRGKAFIYLLFLLALTWIPAMMSLYGALNTFVEGRAEAAFAQVPSLSIEGGRVSVDVEQPYMIRGDDGDEVIAIIDTTGTITSLDDQEAGILITETEVIIDRGEGPAQSFSLSEVDDLNFDGESLTRMVRNAAPWVPVLAYPFALVWSYAYRLVQVLVYSMFALLIARQRRLSLDFAALYAITLVAITPAVILKTIVGLAGIEMPFLFVPHVALALGYVYFGVTANRLDSPPDPEPVD